MNKQQLEQIFSKEYQPALWREVLTDVFGVTNLYQTPEPITLNSNEVADSAVELGSFDTTDDRIIGLYRVDLNDNSNIERNRVGLRETLRSVYKYDVDGALVVFVQGDKWRLSFISEIRTLDDEGKIIKQATEPKRYTYLLGRDEKVKTSAIRLASITGKEISLEDIREAFSVESLNEEFYKIVRDYFYQLVGGKVGKGRSQRTYERLLKLPITENKDNEKYFREFAVRLIGRTIFCWFLKVKKSDAGIPLLPESLLSFEAVKKNPNYYHNILERLFFQTLNTPMDTRRDDLPKGCEIIPFLNGGLFEDQPDDYYEANKGTGINNNLNTLKIPDEWFAEFFEEISHYNFTADENSPVDIEFSIDPEMLGRIFENLLAEIDPDTGESARKATGSFYTPREIVSYMVDESLIYYLKAKLETETKGFGFQAIGETQTDMFGNEGRIQQKFEIPLESNRWQKRPEALETALRELFSHDKSEHQFNETETEILIKAIDNCKVLDPACGSGAFPIGILQRLVFLLEKLDKDNKKWELWQKEKAIEETKKAFEEGDKTQRDARLKEISDAFEKDSSGYGRKLFLIERCIYGVDIQPIAAEISKLRCFLTLVVDDTVDEGAENRGVRHLPNLEFKFVTADALLKLPQSSLFNSDTQLTELEKIRTAYLQSYGEKKVNLKTKFKQLQGDILDEQTEASGDMQDERAIKLGGWKPFEHEKTDWFDPLWMFGVRDFDIVIGNPPYVQMQKDGGRLAKKYVNENYETFERTGDVYSLFYERGFQLLRKKGILTYITSNKWMRTGYGKSLREYLSKQNPQIILDLGPGIFQSATVDTNILIGQKNTNEKKLKGFELTDKKDIFDIQHQKMVSMFNISEQSWIISNEIEQKIKKSIESKGIPLKNWKIQIFRGITTGFNDAFILNEREKINLTSKEPATSELIKPLLKGKNISKFKVNWAKLYLIFIPWHFPLHKDSSIIGASKKAESEFKTKLPYLYEHLLGYKESLCERNKAETGIRYEWYALQRCAATFYQEFDKPKIIYQEMVQESSFSYDENTNYFCLDTGRIITGEKLKFLLAILNSSLFFYSVKHFYGGGGLGKKGVRMKHTFFQNFPVPRVQYSEPFENLVDYILFLKDSDNTEQINEYVPNSHLAEQFEEVIDALVYELYFEEDFQRENIEFIKYAERDFPSIENLELSEKIKTIHAAYQKLRQKDNEIRNNLKLMDIKLADLIMPIKTAN